MGEVEALVERPLNCWVRVRVGQAPYLVGRVGGHVALESGSWLVTGRVQQIQDGVAITVTEGGQERRYRLGEPMPRRLMPSALQAIEAALGHMQRRIDDVTILWPPAPGR